jgi:hypothetical protein
MMSDPSAGPIQALLAAGWYEDAEGNLIRPIPEATFGFTVQVKGYGDKGEDCETDATRFLLRLLGRTPSSAARITVHAHDEQIWPPL